MATKFLFSVFALMTCLVSVGRDKIQETAAITADVQIEHDAEEMQPVSFNPQEVSAAETASPVDVLIGKISAQGESDSITVDISAVSQIREQDAVRITQTIRNTYAGSCSNVNIQIVGIDKLDACSAAELLIQAIRVMAACSNITIVIPNIGSVDYASMTEAQKIAIMQEIAKVVEFKSLKWYEMENLTDAGTGVWALLKRVQRKVKNGQNVDEEFKLFIRMIAETDTLNTYKEKE